MDTATRTTESEEIALKELLQILWSGRWLIVCVTAAFTILAGVASFLVTKTYEASILLSPISTNAGGGSLGGLSSLTASLGGLAALAGVSVGADTKKSESVAVLQSEGLTETYIQQRNLLPVLFHDQWDARAQKWKETDPKKMPTLWKANQFFKKQVRRLSVDSKTGLVTLTIAWRDPQLAATWANDLVRMANSYLQQKAVAEAERNIAYLYDEAAKTTVVQVRDGIYTVLETEIKQEMLARGTDEYAFKVLDAAKPPEKAASPQKIVWVLMGWLVGLLVSVLWVLGRSAWRRSGIG